MYVGLITLLYAGTPLLCIFEYSISYDVVKNVEKRRISAGNLLCIKRDTSETLRNEIIVNSDNLENVKHVSNIVAENLENVKHESSIVAKNLENVKRISEIVPKHLKPLNNEEFSNYLAGWIDGKGHFINYNLLIIEFNYLDLFLAQYIRKKIGYGKIVLVADKTRYFLMINGKKGILHVINLVNGKLKTNLRFDQAVNKWLNYYKYWNKDQDPKFIIDITRNFDNNHWLAGFSDAQGSFQLELNEQVSLYEIEINLNFQLYYPYDYILKSVQKYLGGNIEFNKSHSTYYYNSITFGSARNVIKYFDKYHLQSTKYLSYLKWRQVYSLLQNKKDITKKELLKIRRIDSSINKF
uniref:Homing endonuclease LAGLIDADG domain-containing protein n=1 Tax=Shiraia bambusicola TaxID=224420 RepID=A0A0D3QJ21_9PLEO|nr:hypothetical protein [Shiraia bambusicola]AJI44503.1 hypothetical protein [Shiraia bambusicola]